MYVYLKEMLLAGHLYRVTMQKVPQILRQKPGKISKNYVFPIKKRQKTAHIKKKNTDLLHWSCPQLNR